MVIPARTVEFVKAVDLVGVCRDRQNYPYHRLLKSGQVAGASLTLDR